MTGAVVVCDVDEADAAVLRYSCEIAVIGGGVGGVAAALSALKRGRSVVLTEESSMLGGQFTTQLVPPDEHYWVEASMGAHGQTTTYADLRQRVRDSYKAHRPVTAAFKNSAEPDPGNSWVSRLTAEPLVWRNRINDLLAPYLASGKLRVLYGYRPESAAVVDTHVNKVAVRHGNGSKVVVAAKYFIDATELGDLLPVVGANHTVGREANTGELNNQATSPDPADQQAFTWVAAVGYDPDGDYRTGQTPPDYAAHKPTFEEFFASRLFDPTREWAWTNDSDGTMRDNPNYWAYRRVIAKANFTVPIEEVTLLNYACNDYKTGAILGVTATERDQHLAAAKNLTACLVHYLQNDIPRRDGAGHGYRGLRLRPDIAGTSDGYAERPYIREARRLVSVGRVWEWHVGVDARPDHSTAHQFGDSVGTGHYWLDVHAGPKMVGGLWRRCYTYQVPLMALIPNNRTNVLAGGKCLGVSHIVNGAYRLHPTEWTVGEAAGTTAHCAIAWSITPKQIRSTFRIGTLQTNLLRQGVQLAWPNGIKSKWDLSGTQAVKTVEERAVAEMTGSAQ